jgi:hypothetical protein
MELYSATKKNKMLSFAGKWMELENIILRKISQAQKDLIQIQQYYEKPVALKGVTYYRDRIKERN